MAYLRRNRTCNWYVYWVRTDSEERALNAEVGAEARNQARLCIQGPNYSLRAADSQELFSFAEVTRMLAAGDFASIPGFTEADGHLLIPALWAFVVDVRKEYPLGASERHRAPYGLDCPRCGQRLEVEGILGLARLAPAEWLHFRCPECKTQSYLDFSETGIAIGNFDGFPEPTFIPVSSLSVEQLHVLRHRDGLRVKIGEREWSFEIER